jgi:hypothetical protein
LHGLYVTCDLLDQDALTAPEDALPDIRADLVIVGGEVGLDAEDRAQRPVLSVARSRVLDEAASHEVPRGSRLRACLASLVL